MKLPNIAARFAACLLFSAVAGQLSAADCSADRVFREDFESVSGVALNGDVIGLSAGTVEVRIGDDAIPPLASATLLHGGRFSVALPPLPEDAVLRLRVRGSGAQDFIELASHVELASQALGSLAEQNFGSVDAGAVDGLVVTAESTARYALVAQANAGQPAVDACRLATLQPGLDPAAVDQRTAVIKLAIEAGGIGGGAGQAIGKGSPPGTTLDLLLDPSAYAEEVTRLEDEMPAQFAAMQALLGEDFCDYFQGSVYALLRDRDVDLNAAYSARYDFDSATTGQVSATTSQDTFDFACDSDGARFDFAGATPTEYLAFEQVNGEFQQVLARRTDLFSELRPLDATPTLIALEVRTRSRITYPDTPELPDQEFEGVGTRFALLRSATGNAFDPNAEPGDYALPLGEFNTPDSSIAVLLLSGGAGSTIESAEPVDWITLPDGSLMLELADRSVILLPYRNDGPARDVFATIEYDDGRRRTDVGLAYRRDPAAAPTLADVPGSYTQYDGRTQVNLAQGPFVFVLDQNSTGVNTQTGRDYGWDLDAQSRIVLRSCNNAPLFAEPAFGQCGSYERRIFDVYLRDGDAWHIHETRHTFAANGAGQLEPSIVQHLNRPYGYVPAGP